jgi:hypothetical protein
MLVQLATFTHMEMPDSTTMGDRERDRKRREMFSLE